MRPLSTLLLLLLALPAVRAADEVDFDTEIVPVLTRHGCNAGSCHGAAIGRGGFKLSLLGTGAAADHSAIARQLQGRRVTFLIEPPRPGHLHHCTVQDTLRVLEMLPPRHVGWIMEKPDPRLGKRRYPFFF